MATLSHELRTPLNAIAGSAQLLKGHDNSTRLQTSCDTIIDSAMGLADMASEMLDFSQLAYHQVKVNNKAENLPLALHHLTQPFQALASEKGLSFNLAISSELQKGYLLDWPKLQRVLTNLLGNAIKFTEKGSVSITVKPQGAGIIYFEVKDSGIGIVASDALDLLQPFQRGSNIDNQTEGSGLGLAIVSKLLLTLDSQLQIDSELGKGSRFYFNLASESCELAKALPPKVTPISKALEVLVIEDNPINYKIIKAMLEQDKHKVMVAENGKAAITISQTRPFDVILLDMHLPDMTGIDTYQHITQQQGNPNQDTRFIAVTASLLETEIEHYQQAGVSLLVSKPISQRILREALFYSQQQEQSVVLHSLDRDEKAQSDSTLYDPEPLTWMQHAVSSAELGQHLQQLPKVLERYIQQAEMALTQNIATDFKRYLHKLAGSAAQVGLRRLAQSAADIEKRDVIGCRQQHLDELRQLCKQSISAQQAWGEQ